MSGELQNAALVLAFSEGETEDASNETLHYPMTLSTTTATLDPSQTLKVTSNHTLIECTRVTAFLCQSLYTVCDLQSACNTYTDEYSRIGGGQHVMLMPGFCTHTALPVLSQTCIRAMPCTPQQYRQNLHLLQACSH